MTGAEGMGPPDWLQTLFLGLLAIGFMVLSVWGLTVRSLAIHLQAQHADWAETLRSRSRRRVARLAVVSELQTALATDEEIPQAVRDDARAATLIAREAGTRRLFVPIALAAFGVYVLGAYV